MSIAYYSLFFFFLVGGSGIVRSDSASLFLVLSFLLLLWVFCLVERKKKGNLNKRIKELIFNSKKRHFFFIRVFLIST